MAPNHEFPPPVPLSAADPIQHLAHKLHGYPNIPILAIEATLDTLSASWLADGAAIAVSAGPSRRHRLAGR